MEYAECAPLAAGRRSRILRAALRMFLLLGLGLVALVLGSQAASAAEGPAKGSTHLAHAKVPVKAAKVVTPASDAASKLADKASQRPAARMVKTATYARESASGARDSVASTTRKTSAAQDAVATATEKVAAETVATVEAVAEPAAQRVGAATAEVTAGLADTVKPTLDVAADVAPSLPAKPKLGVVVPARVAPKANVPVAQGMQRAERASATPVGQAAAGAVAPAAGVALERLGQLASGPTTGAKVTPVLEDGQAPLPGPAAPTGAHGLAGASAGGCGGGSNAPAGLMASSIVFDIASELSGIEFLWGPGRAGNIRPSHSPD